MTTSNSDVITYAGNCHCGAVKYKATIASIHSGSVIQCNCSHCSSKGLLLIHCLRSSIEFTQGYEGLKKYYYRTSGMAFKFCGECGTSIFWDVDGDLNGREAEMVSLNVSLRARSLRFILVAYN